MKTLFIAIVFFAAGLFGSDFVFGAYRLFFGSVEVNCLPDGGICVGDDVSKKRVGGLPTFDRIGGLTLIICSKPDDAMSDYLSVEDIVKGERCDARSYMLEFRNSRTRTLVEVESGKVDKITRGPLHIIDL